MAAAAKTLQSWSTLCDPRDGSPPGSAIPGILQARTLEWVAISFSNAWKWKVKVKSLSCVRPLATPWTAAYQAPPSMGFSRQEYWSGVPLPSPRLGGRWQLNGPSFFGERAGTYFNVLKVTEVMDTQLCEYNKTVNIIYFKKHNVFDVHACCSLYQIFYCWVVFHSTNVA